MEKIELNHVSKKFHRESILEDVCLKLFPGNIYGFIGPNGSGKTVLLKMIAGLMRPSGGTIYLDQKQIGKDLDFPPSMGVLIETPDFLPNYSGMQNLLYLAKIKKLVDREQIMHTMKLVGIDYAAERKAGKYSLGMKQRLGIAQAIMEDPELIILDEPMNGLDQRGIAEIRKLLLELKKNNKLILLASHTREDMKMLCDQVFYIRDKKIDLKRVREEPYHKDLL